MIKRLLDWYEHQDEYEKTAIIVFGTVCPFALCVFVLTLLFISLLNIS